jgi:hypothetical protein
MALGGAVLTLFDTRLILLVGAMLSAWAAYRMRVWGAAGSGVAQGAAADRLT